MRLDIPVRISHSRSDNSPNQSDFPLGASGSTGFSVLRIGGEGVCTLAKRRGGPTSAGRDPETWDETWGAASGD